MADFTNVDFEDGYGKIISPTFSDLFVWNEDNQEYVYDENVLDYAQKMYDKCRDSVFSSFLRKLIDYDKNLWAEVNISDKQILVTVYSDYGHGQYPMQFNFRFKNNDGNVSITLA
jgi:hypothetical protein